MEMSDLLDKMSAVTVECSYCRGGTHLQGFSLQEEEGEEGEEEQEDQDDQEQEERERHRGAVRRLLRKRGLK